MFVKYCMRRVIVATLVFYRICSKIIPSDPYLVPLLVDGETFVATLLSCHGTGV